MDDTSVASFILLQRKGLERLNATRMSVAADGLTEANLYLLPLGADANESLPVYHEKAPFGVPFQLNPPLRVGEIIFDDESLPWVG